MMAAGMKAENVAEELGISRASAYIAVGHEAIDKGQVEVIKERIQDRLIVASDRFLTHSLERIQDLHPYQAMLCAGIAHDHYLRSRAASQSTGQAGSVTNILIQIDKSLRVQANKTPDDTDR